MILTIRTDKPVSEVGLFDGEEQLDYYTWQAHRELAETIHQKLEDLLVKNNNKLSDIQGVVVFKGPGSFTGLRIGISLANALAAGLEIPIIGEVGDDWIASGIKKLGDGTNDKSVVPHYGAPVHITTPKK
ncbi:MAG: tRNA (adenosine(37)-N6)-threonylcarbamoyltransferase complex dimerization subunit type 1 TsaB [Candidatus Saccharimonadales bacterium]